MNYELSVNGVVIITIDVKDRPMNILTPDLHNDIGKVAEQLASDEKAIGAVIQSGKSSFVAGGDLKRIVGLYDLNRSPEDAYLQSRVFTEALRKLETCGKPVACAINGAALGGGLELALACHYRIVIDDPKIPLGLPETSVGLIPGAGGTQRLPRLIGIKDAAELIISGSHISPQQALKLGMVDQLVKKEDLLSEATRWVLEEGNAQQAWDKRGFQIPGGSTLNNRKIAKLSQDLTTRVAVESRYNYPAPIAALESIINGTTVSSFDAALKIETREFSKLTRNPVARNMMRTLFLNKGIADKLDRRPLAVDKFKATQAVILGMPISSNNLAFICASAGIEVISLASTINDESQSMQDYTKEQLALRITSGKSTQEKADAIVTRIKSGGDKQNISQADVILITTKTDAKALKQQLADISDSALIAVTTTELDLNEVFAALPDSRAIIGWQISQPAEHSQVVEIVLPKKHSDETLAKALDFSQQLRKTPVVQIDDSTLFTQACNFSYLEESLRMLSEGVSPILIENAARDAGMRKAPLQVIDELSLTSFRQSLSSESTADNVLKSMLEEHGRSGVIENKGFYDYEDSKRVSIWPELSKHFPMNAKQPEVEDLKQRLLSIQALKAVSYYDSKLMDTADADIASVLVYGFPSYTGGVLSYIDTMGLTSFISQCERLTSLYGQQFTVPKCLQEQVKASNRIYATAA